MVVGSGVQPLVSTISTTADITTMRAITSVDANLTKSESEGPCRIAGMP